MSLTDAQRALLDAPIDPKLIKVKPVQGSPKYIEGHVAIGNANRIFGYENWGYSVDKIDRFEAPGGVLYTALVTVTVTGAVPRQDIGAEIASFTKEGKPPAVAAHDTAIKGAVTDGIKRALRAYGDQFGAQLYEKGVDLRQEYAEWEAAERGREATKRTARRTTNDGRAVNPQTGEIVGVATSPISTVSPLVVAQTLLIRDEWAYHNLPVPIKDQTPEQLDKTEAWLQRRSLQRGGLPDPLPEHIMTIVEEATSERVIEAAKAEAKRQHAAGIMDKPTYDSIDGQIAARLADFLADSVERDAVEGSGDDADAE